MTQFLYFALVILIMNNVNESILFNVKTFQYEYQNISQLLFYGKETKYIISATKNYLLKFSIDNLSKPLEVRKTGPVNDSILCTKPDLCSMAICSTELRNQDKCRKKLTDVFVKSWTLSETELIVCFNVYQGYCETIDLLNEFTSGIKGKAYSIVTYDVNSHSTLLYFDHKLYTAIEINHSLNYQSHDFAILSIRTLPNFEIVKAEDNVFNVFHGVLGRGSDIIFPLEFKGSFHITDNREDNMVTDYIFFLVNQPENKIETKNGKVQVRLARICSKDDEFSSFIDVGLNCGDPNIQTYYTIDSWHLSKVGKNLSDWYRKNTMFKGLSNEEKANFDQILFINFKVIKIKTNYLETLQKFVTCAYPIAELMELLDIVKKNCQNGFGSINDRPYDVHSADKSCLKEYFQDSYKGYCDIKVRNKHIIGDHYGDFSGKGHEIIIKDGLRASSINVFSVYDIYTIALIGGSNGHIYEFEFFEKSFKELVAQNMFETEVLDIKIVENKTIAFAISNSKIGIVNLTQCDMVTTCEFCINLNPFCGWCTSTGKCSIQDQCKVSFWIPYERNINSKRCPEIINLNSHNILEYNSDKIPEVKFQIIKIPEGILTGSLRCEYYSKANFLIKKVNVTYIKNSSVVCNSIAQKDIPQISNTDNFVTIKLKVFVDNSFLVENKFDIYDCSKSKTCSQCSENQFLCSWCILDNTCIAAFPNSCIKTYFIESKMSHKCPKFEFLSKTVAFSAGSPIEIDLKVKNFIIYQGMDVEFLCIESCGNTTVKASLAQDILNCRFNNVKNPFNGAINCSVSVIWKLDNFISGYLENTNIFSFQIYNCSRLAEHCDDCLFLPQNYNCGFCIKSKKCVMKSDCKSSDDRWINNRDQYCPSPIINEIIPGNSTLASESKILVKGRNLDFDKADVKTSVSFENNLRSIKCIFIDELYISSKQFMCQIQKVTDTSVLPVTFDFVYRSLRSSYLAKKEFVFYTPKVTKINPDFGPFMGGSIIKILGNSLNVGSKRIISFIFKTLKTECDIIENFDTTIMCRLKDFFPSSRSFRRKRNSKDKNFEAFISLSVDLKTFNYTDVLYNFYANPTNIRISRDRFLSNGGQFFEITGMNIHIINRPYISFKCKVMESNFSWCYHQSKVLNCVTPTIEVLTKMTVCELHLYMEKTVLLYNTTVSIYPTPKFEQIIHRKTLPSTSWSFIEKRTKDDNIIKFKFNAKDQIHFSAFELKELNIFIGKLICQHVVVSTRFIECNLFPKEVNIYQKYPVIINIGENIHISLGFIQFTKGEISLDTLTLVIIVALIIIVFVFIIALSLVIVKKMQKKNRKKHLNRDIFSEKIEREANEILKQGISELNDVTIQHDVNKNCLPMYPYCVYILYNLFPNTHPRFLKGSRPHPDSILNINDYHYDSNDPNSHPLIFNKPIQVIEHTIEYSRKLSKLFEDELFVLILFSFLEDDAVADSKKSDIVSLLSLILMQDMANYTKILKILIKDDYDRKKECGEEKAMFRHSDLLSKLLSNWFIILMYDHFQTNNPGGDLLTLYFLILSMINNGPVDSILNQSQYALNENKLLKGKVNYSKMKIKVKYPNILKGVNNNMYSMIDIDILDCDTVPQVKLKIFEEICKYIPFSKWCNMDEFDLVKTNFVEENEQYDEKEKLVKPKALKEIDRDTNCFKTMCDHNVKDGETICLFQTEDVISRCNSTNVCQSFNIESKSNSLKTNNSVNINKVNVNLKPGEEIQSKPLRHVLINYDPDSSEKSKISCFKKKTKESPLDSKEINSCCLIYTQVLKKRLEPSIKLLFDDILDHDLVPHCIKDLFGYFNSICKDEKALFSFKSNSLILRFWIHFITNIDFLFDVPLASNIPVMECLTCIGRILMDVCSECQNSDVWITQLFSDIIKEYSPKVIRYYDSVSLPEDDNNEFYDSISIEGINISLAIVILYQNYIKPIHDKFIEAIKKSNKPVDRQNKWITILKEVNNLYSPEVFFSNGNGDVATSAC